MSLLYLRIRCKNLLMTMSLLYLRIRSTHFLRLRTCTKMFCFYYRRNNNTLMEDFDLDLDEIFDDMDKYPIRVSLVQTRDERNRYVSEEERCLVKTIDIMKRDMVLIDEFQRIKNHDDIIMLFHRRFCEENDGVRRSIFKADIEYIMNSGYFAINDPVNVENEACTWYAKVSMVDIGTFKWWLKKTRIMYERNLTIYENQLHDILCNPRYVLQEIKLESAEEKKCFIIS